MLHCKNCKAKLADIDIYCLMCGRPTEEYKKQFKLSEILKSAKSKTALEPHVNIIYYITIAFVFFSVIYLFVFDLINISYWIDYINLNIIMIFLCPLLILPLANILDNERKIQFKYYPKLVIFTFFMALYFFVLKIVCQGDPILNIVRFVMVLWGVSIVFPVPFLIFTKSDSVIKLILKGYIAGKYLRWHQLSLSLILGIKLLFSAVLLFIPFSTTMVYASNVMLIWYQKQEKFELYDKDKNY